MLSFTKRQVKLKAINWITGLLSSTPKRQYILWHKPSLPLYFEDKHVVYEMDKQLKQRMLYLTYFGILIPVSILPFWISNLMFSNYITSIFLVPTSWYLFAAGLKGYFSSKSEISSLYLHKNGREITIKVISGKKYIVDISEIDSSIYALNPIIGHIKSTVYLTTRTSIFKILLSKYSLYDNVIDQEILNAILQGQPIIWNGESTDDKNISKNFLTEEEINEFLKKAYEEENDVEEESGSGRNSKDDKD